MQDMHADLIFHPMDNFYALVMQMVNSGSGIGELVKIIEL
jgi:hypothetical protein